MHIHTHAHPNPRTHTRTHTLLFSLYNTGIRRHCLQGRRGAGTGKGLQRHCTRPHSHSCHILDALPCSVHARTRLVFTVPLTFPLPLLLAWWTLLLTRRHRQTHVYGKRHSHMWQYCIAIGIPFFFRSEGSFEFAIPSTPPFQSALTVPLAVFIALISGMVFVRIH